MKENITKLDSLYSKPKSNVSSGEIGLSTNLTAKEKFRQDPYIARHYKNQIESLTKQKIPDIQIKEVKKALKQTEFRKLGPVELKKGRDSWNNNKTKFIKEWEDNTGKKWPVYKEPVYGKDGIKVVGREGKPVSGHHIIELSHGGPNAWWNITPLHIKDHDLLHSKQGMAYKIFKQNVKKK